MRLFPYQEEAVKFIGEKKKVYLAMDMGTGKTITAIAAAAKYAQKNILVIAELNEIQNSQNFKKEVETHFQGELQYHNLREKETPPLAIYEPRYVCGINPDGLKKLDPKFIAQCFDVVIIDEATMAKTTTTARFKMVLKICRLMKYVILLSGTPMMNGASELFAPLLLLGHDLAGKGTQKAREAFETIFAAGHWRKVRNTGIYWQDYAWIAKEARYIRELRYMIGNCFFFVQKETLGMFRHKSRFVRNVPMSVEWVAEYMNAWNEYLKDARKRKVDMDNVAELQKLIENGQCYQVNSKYKAIHVVEEIRAKKFAYETPPLVFTMFRETEEYLIAEGGMPYQEYIEKRPCEPEFVVATIGKHAKGGNMPELNTTLFIDMSFVPAQNLQAENRIDRPEQTRDMQIIYYLTEGSDVVDAHVRDINKKKREAIDEFMRPFDDAELARMPEAVGILEEGYEKEFNSIRE